MVFELNLKNIIAKICRLKAFGFHKDFQLEFSILVHCVYRCQDGSGWPQLMIFPEGSTSNRKALMSFKPGAFVPGKPVQPILIRYELFIWECQNNFWEAGLNSRPIRAGLL